MAGLTTRTYKDSYKNVVIIDDSAWTGVKTTMTALKDGAGVSLPLAVSIDSLQVANGKRLRFGNADNYIHNSGAKVLDLTSERVKINGKLVLAAGNNISAASLVGTNLSIANVRGTGAVSGFARIRGTLVSGTTIKAGGTKITNAGVSATAIDIGGTRMNSGGITLPSGGKLLTIGGTGVHSPGTGELQFNVASVGIAIMDSDEFYPKTNEVPTLGKTGYRWSALYSKSVYCNSITASTVDLKGGNYKGALASVTSLKAPTGNVSTLTNKTFNRTNVNGTLAKFTTASAATTKGTLGVFTTASAGTTKGNTGIFETVIGGDMIITSGKFTVENIPTASEGLSYGTVWASSTGVLMIVQ